MFPGIFDNTFATVVWQVAEALIPFAFAIVVVSLVWRLFKGIMP